MPGCGPVPESQSRAGQRSNWPPAGKSSPVEVRLGLRVGLGEDSQVSRARTQPGSAPELESSFQNPAAVAAAQKRACRLRVGASECQ